MKLVKVEMFPDIDFDYIYITVETPPGTEVEITDNIARRIEKIVKEDVPEATQVVSTVGERGPSAYELSFGSGKISNYAEITVELLEGDEYARASHKEIQKRIKPRLDKIPGTVYPDLPPGSYVKLTVSDTGTGIDNEIKDRIFDPYFTTKEVGKGTGIGLSVVHGIVKSHNGAILVDSQFKKGTTFSIFFPVAEETVVIEAEPDDEFPTGNERILIVDDEKSMADIGRKRLERLGYEVEARTDPMEALELFRADPDQFDLVITDMTMPHITGDNLVKEILKIRPDMPTILCTGFSEKINEEKAKKIGAREYIDKPFDRGKLSRLVRKVLDHPKTS